MKAIVDPQPITIEMSRRSSSNGGGQAGEVRNGTCGEERNSGSDEGGDAVVVPSSSRLDDDMDDNIHDDDSSSLLGAYPAAALLTADILGTGLLALPNNIKVLGNVLGLSFLILNLPLNLYAGTILSQAASHVERDERSWHRTATTTDNDDDDDTNEDGLVRRMSHTVMSSPDASHSHNEHDEHEARRSDRVMMTSNGRDGLVRVIRTPKSSRNKYTSVNHQGLDRHSEQELSYRGSSHNEDDQDDGDGAFATEIPPPPSSNKSDQPPPPPPELMPDENSLQHHAGGATTADHDNNKELSSTRDFIGVTQALFHHPAATRLVTAIFYGNIFLVLGDYILVQSHAVAAVVGEGSICLPTAGLLASTLMFGFSQLRTMAHLGHSVTVLSLTCLALVVVQCLVAAERDEPEPGTYTPPTETPFLRKLSALASIGFATGTNKLLLNIRHEMKHREEAPKTLAISQVAYGSFYVSICVLAGPNPPSFLFDSIPAGPTRRMAGLLLWIHVAVSYAINSQALTASMDRRYYHPLCAPYQHARTRWLVLTAGLTISSYMVANVVPFFKDLVALIGALTTVPLTLLLPVLFHRRSHQLPLWWPTRSSAASYGLLLFGMAYLVVGLAGSLGSIEMDWSGQGGPFSCTV